MAIPYQAVKTAQAGVNGGGQYKYYARAGKRELYSYRELSKSIAKISTVSEIDAAAVLAAFAKLIPDLLKEGKSIDLGDLGILSVHLKSEGRESAEDVRPNTIKGVRIHFRPSVQLKKEMNNAEFRKVQ